MKSLTTLVISMSTNLNVQVYYDILGNCVLLIYSNSLDRTLFYSNMTVPRCIRQGSKINYDFLTQGLNLKSHQRCSAGNRTWLSADQSSSSTLTESSFLFDPCLIQEALSC